MTFLEKLKEEHPEKVDERCAGGCVGCPSNYGYEENYDCRGVTCKECWHREMAVGFYERCDKNCDECDLLYAQGTIGEIKETYRMGIKALEKQIAKKPNRITAPDINIVALSCGACSNALWFQFGTLYNYCPYCGNRIDWGNEDAV